MVAQCCGFGKKGTAVVDLFAVPLLVYLVDACKCSMSSNTKSKIVTRKCAVHEVHVYCSPVIPP